MERIVGAAEQLMRERGSDDFTLAEVCQLGSVSMGAIYYRFSSKDELLRLVHSRLMEGVETEMKLAIGRNAHEAQDLPQLVRAATEALAETLRKFAPLLRPLMLRSISDPIIRAAGKDTYAKMGADFAKAIRSRQEDIRFPDPLHAVETSYAIAYAALGRSLGLNVSPGHVEDILDWYELKRSLSLMCASYLLAPEHLIVGLYGKKLATHEHSGDAFQAEITK